MQDTAYGTSSLASDARLSATTLNAANRRRKLINGSLALLATGTACSTLVLLGASSLPDGATGPMEDTEARGLETPPAMQSELTCFQSSYLDNVTAMMQPVDGLKWTHATDTSTKSFIAVDVDTQYQEIKGFGGAFTEASALQFAKLSREKQEEVLALYFDKTNGSAYTFGRVPMGSCDFSVSSYNFAGVVNDTKLEHFDMGVKHDTEVLIPFIKRALDRVPDMKLFLAPWSPPAWMKRGGPKYVPSMLGSMDPVGLKDNMQETWALYFSKFITAYKHQGIPFWGLTPQNEPEFGAPWESCMYNPAYQAEFIGNHLGPMLERDHPELTLMVFDHNRGSVRKWAEVIYNHPTAAQYVDGMAFHWYDMERIMDGAEYHERLNDTHFMDQSRFMLATESCNCPDVATGDQAWFRAQRYGHDIMTDLNNYVAGWVDWNLILDHKGGPNHLGNNCDAPLILTEDETDFFVQPMYYFIQHFSRFIPPGSRRVKTQVAAQFETPGDAQLFVNYQAALAPCDGSSRQLVHVTEDSKMQVTGTPFCLSMVDVPYEGQEIRLVECQYTQQSWTFEEETQRVRIGAYCLSLNHGSAQDGVRVTAEFCEADVVAHQQWVFSTEDGTMRSRASPVLASQCVTAGYSFVQAAAFVTPEDKKVLVVLNENTEPADFELQVGGVALETTIPQGAIRTYTWE